MKQWFFNFKKEFTSALDLFDKKETEILCKELVKYINQAGVKIPIEKAEDIMQKLKNKRMFRLMHEIGDAMLNTGYDSYKIRKLYAQSLIDDGIYTGALNVLDELADETERMDTQEADKENREAYGLRGRLYKQLYVNADQPENPFFRDYIKLAIKNYAFVYNKGWKQNLWHAINLAATIRRAEADGVELNESGLPDVDALAKDILGFIAEKENMQKPVIWEYAIAVEACVVLNKGNDAQKWALKYVTVEEEVDEEDDETGEIKKVKKKADAFEIGSTLRQLQQLWRLDEDKGMGKLVLPVLQAALLKQQGGAIELDTRDLLHQHKTDDEYYKALQKNFSNTKVLTFEWYLKGKDRCFPVARIGTNAYKGLGTGFLLEGKNLHKQLENEIVLVTNAHVVSNDQLINQGSIRPGSAIVIFEALDRSMELRIRDLFWTSSCKELDVSILLFDQKSLEKLEPYKQELKYYSVATRELTEMNDERLYIIGHPKGESLKISLQDNVFLAAKDPFIHYRTPTEPGSSGSPVFDQNWDLVAIHHAGSDKKPKLDNSGETYEANEGIWIQRIIAEMNK